MHVSCHSTMKRGADRLRRRAAAADDAGLPASISGALESGSADRASGSGPRRAEDGTRMPAVVAV